MFDWILHVTHASIIWVQGYQFHQNKVMRLQQMLCLITLTYNSHRDGLAKSMSFFIFKCNPTFVIVDNYSPDSEEVHAQDNTVWETGYNYKLHPFGDSTDHQWDLDYAQGAGLSTISDLNICKRPVFQGKMGEISHVISHIGLQNQVADALS